MKHVNLSKIWTFSTEPFPAFRASIIKGRRKRDFKFIPVVGGIILEPKARVVKKVAPTGTKMIEEKTETLHLPDGRFKVIKTKEKGTIIFVPGEETTNRVLLFVDACGGYRGDVEVHPETTAKVLQVCYAANNCYSSLAVAAILNVGQELCISSCGWRVHEDNVVVYSWDGAELSIKEFHFKEWAAMRSSHAPENTEEI